MRIVSFVPAATSVACVLGAGAELVGITHECGGVADLSGLTARVLTRSRLPSGASGSVIDGAVKNAAAQGNELQLFDGELLAQLQPDLVIVPAEQSEGRNPCALSFFDIRRVTSVMSPAPRLVAFGANTLPEAFGSIRALGEALGKGADAARLVAELRQRVEFTRDRLAHALTRPRVALLSWIQPPVGAGGLLAQLVQLAGGEPVACEPRLRAKALDWAQVVATRPQVLVLAPCSFPLDRVRLEAESLRKVPGLAETPAARWGQIHVVDALAWFSAPGMSSVGALEILAALIHPELPWPDDILARTAARPVAVD